MIVITTIFKTAVASGIKVENYTYALDTKDDTCIKNQGVKEFHMLASIGSYCKIMVFSPFKVQVTYYHSSKGNK